MKTIIGLAMGTTGTIIAVSFAGATAVFCGIGLFIAGAAIAISDYEI